jgi:hypothetical protein
MVVTNIILSRRVNEAKNLVVTQIEPSQLNIEILRISAPQNNIILS